MPEASVYFMLSSTCNTTIHRSRTSSIQQFYTKGRTGVPYRITFDTPTLLAVILEAGVPGIPQDLQTFSSPSLVVYQLSHLSATQGLHASNNPSVISLLSELLCTNGTRRVPALSSLSTPKKFEVHATKFHIYMWIQHTNLFHEPHYLIPFYAKAMIFLSVLEC